MDGGGVIKVNIKNEIHEIVEQATLKVFLPNETNDIVFEPVTDFDDFEIEVQIIKRDIVP